MRYSRDVYVCVRVCARVRGRGCVCTLHNFCTGIQTRAFLLPKRAKYPSEHYEGM